MSPRLLPERRRCGGRRAARRCIGRAGAGPRPVAVLLLVLSLLVGLSGGGGPGPARAAAPGVEYPPIPSPGAVQGVQAAAPGAARFVPGTDDLPLMPGLEPVPGSVMVFESPAGRLVEAYAWGQVPVAAARAFYEATLPQLGWRRRGRDHFVREGEDLTLDFLIQPSQVTVRFSLAPGN